MGHADRARQQSSTDLSAGRPSICNRRHRRYYVVVRALLVLLAIFIALLRAVNVGGTGLLPMKELSRMCTELGFRNVQTYTQSSNVFFESRLSEKSNPSKLDELLTKKLKKRDDFLGR